MEVSCCPLLSRFIEQKVEFARADIAANLLIPMLFLKGLIPLIELGQFLFGKGLDGRFDVMEGCYAETNREASRPKGSHFPLDSRLCLVRGQKREARFRVRKGTRLVFKRPRPNLPSGEIRGLSGVHTGFGSSW